MTNTNSTKRALLASVIAMIVCISMLIGATIAWFSDTATSGDNVIVAGILNVELYNGLTDAADKVTAGTKLFDDVALWEPGAVAYENLTVTNEGSLAFKYQLSLNVTEATETPDGKTLADVLKVAIVPGGFTGSREDAKALTYNYSLTTFAMEGKLNVGEEPDVYGIVVYWQPTNNDNDYNMNEGQAPLSVKIGVSLYATHLVTDTEKDSFGSEYDAGVTLPPVSSAATNVNNDGSASMEVANAPSANTNKTTIEAPAGAFEPTDKVEVDVDTTNSLFDVTAEGGVVASLDITLTVNNEETSADLADGKTFTVTTYISKGLERVGVTYTGDDGKDQPTLVSYDPVTGKLVFTTNHFSNYDVTGAALAYDAVNDTALVSVEQIVEARKDESKVFLIPEENQAVIEELIQALPEEEREEAIAATYAARVGETNYASLTEALKAAEDGDTVTLLNDIIISNDWDNRFNGAKTTKTITIDGQGKTLKLTGTISDGGNYHSVFRFENNATVRNLTFDLSEAKGYGTRVRAIAAKADLVVDNCTFIGNEELTNTRAIIFGEGAGAAISDLDVSVTGCTFINWRKGVSDNENAQDANTVVIMNNKFKNAGVGVSASKNVTFVGNTMENGSVNITSYTDLDALELVAENNKLDETKDNVLGNTAYVVTVKMLESALNAGLDVVLNSDLTFDASETKANSGYGATGISVKGSVLDGNGHTLTVTGANGTWGCTIHTTGGTIKNLTVAGAMRGIFTGGLKQDLYVENVTFKNVVYTFNGDGTPDATYSVHFENCTMNGWTSYSNMFKEVVFKDCTFTKGSGYEFCRPYNACLFENCVFTGSFQFDASKTSDITFKGCYYGETLITAENATSLVSDGKVFFSNGLNGIDIQ